ncbi:MAG: hypothetical protein CMH49_02105 [Myxococcales bacterium]|nr:hypothetical protein [Myxococcales bacterium]
MQQSLKEITNQNIIMENFTMEWILFGKLPVLICLSIAAWSSTKRLSPVVCGWGFGAFFVSLSLGIAILPSILGALAFGLLSIILAVSYLTESESLASSPTTHISSLLSDSWRVVLWPLVISLLAIIAIGKVGCWVTGCCFGELSQLPWATHYGHEGFVAEYHLDRYGSLASQGPLPVHPVQLYESLAATLIIGCGFKLKSRLGEVSAASLSIGAYLFIYAILNPLRASINTSASFVDWGPLSKLQWCLFVISIACVIVARSNRNRSSNHRGEVRSRYIMKNVSVEFSLGLWILLALLGGLSLRYGTPFSAQLASMGICLIAVAAVKTISMKTNICDQKHKTRVGGFFTSSPTASWALLAVTLPLALVPLTISGSASPDSSFNLGLNTDQRG